ncbi:MAG: sulfite exporter TauE/SafE family protein [Bacteroidales bacterium]|nr:sulfite exporter TauE/SafE family protein [Bacteroidales bacterium]
MSSLEVIALIVSGVFVGFINTLAGGGTIISLSLFMFMGLPADIANGTNRIAVILQNLTSVTTFQAEEITRYKKSIVAFHSHRDWFHHRCPVIGTD